MTRRYIIVLTSILASLSGAGVDVIDSSAYLAPENQLIFKVVTPGGGFVELERDMSRPGVLRGADGWRGLVDADGTIEVSNGKNAGNPQTMRFYKGRITYCRDKNGERMYPYEEERNSPVGVYPPLLITRAMNEKASKEYAYEQFLHKWDGTGRLAWPFVNPNQNGVLFGELTVFFLMLALSFRNLSVRVFSGLAATASAGLLVWTMSRGAWLGVAVALSLVVAVNFNNLLKGRRVRLVFIGLTIAVAAALGVWLLLFGSGQITRGFESGGWTNAIRMEIWNNAPRMMFDAPEGWGFFNVGAAYLHWYQPISVFALTPTLINDHLTYLAGWSWCWRIVYLFIAALVLLSSVAVLLFKRRGLPAALWTVLAVAAWFNPVAHVWALWILPLLGMVELVRHFPWRRARVLAGTVAASVLMAGLAASFLYFKGRTDSSTGVSIHADGRKVLINGNNPAIWIVDDGTLGGGLIGKDIREFFDCLPSAPAVGFVTSVADLPKKGVRRLVLSGSMCADWLTLLSDDESARENLPDSVIFFAPSFLPSQVPEGVRMMCNPKIIVGEFAARYHEEYAGAADWVVVVPGMEKYILRWMEYVYMR